MPQPAQSVQASASLQKCLWQLCMLLLGYLLIKLCHQFCSTLRSLQDPIHYPHGTKFLAPGPMGQCFAVPDDKKLKALMVKTAENQMKIFNMYNFDYHTQVSWH